MLLTILYMLATVMQTRRISFLKEHLKVVFNRNRPSIMFHTKSSQHLNKNHNGSKPAENVMSSDLCLNKNLAKLGEWLWYQGDIKLCTVYPEQLVNVLNWLAYPRGKTLFPLNANNCCQLSSAPNRMTILVEADLAAYKPQASSKTKLEDYGLIITWIANKNIKNINFILESDADHIMSFITTVMQGQYYINNDLLVTRIQSVLVSGQPCTYDNEPLNCVLDKNVLYSLSDAAAIVLQQQKTVELVKFGAKVYPQNKQSPNVVSPSSTNKESIGDISSTFTRSVASVVPAGNSSPKLDEVCTSTKDNTLLKQTSTAIREKVDDPVKFQSPIIWEKKVPLPAVDFTKRPTTSKASLPTRSEPSRQEEGNLLKPPNVVIYADSPDAISNVKTVLEKALDPDRYIVYALTRDEARSNCWIDQVTLVVVCGNVDAEVSAQLVEYVIHGGKLLALCSDMLHTLLPSFKTAEVRESELVHFSYGKWKRVRMMHHIFCYHASPVRARFFQDHEDTRTALNPPTSTSVKDKRGRLHSFDVKVLGTEETWHNPSILLATLASSGGRVVFSQIHLEVDPMQYEYEEDKFNALKESNAVRLEIIGDLLSTHLGMKTSKSAGELVKYTPAYFLGKFEIKKKMLDKLKSKLQETDMLKLPKLDIRFYTNSVITASASASFLPVMVHLCPENFSTVKYFENLGTHELGRLVIYADLLTSSMHLTEKRLEHGLAVIPRQQTQGEGRGRNIWLSPLGCAMFTLQVHISKHSVLGRRIPLLQHVVAVALISAIRSKRGYEDIDLRLKWPNDIYVGNSAKIGGVTVSTQTDGSEYICNIGVGINLSNSKPTTCINDVIEQCNQKYGKKLSKYSYEQYLAYVFNELEILLDMIEKHNIQYFYDLYYKYWLHANSKVTATNPNGKSENVTISGIDENGFLLVFANDGRTFPIHPDGNSFDLLKGLIAPK
ncbi:biotin--protein ligase isoform X2 [Ooceraea biroi]|uniref:biotin--protein ligase isoform X2 n=1 Tax=Ooceraea biroi TaxID=2015173 RepID=UPI000F088039|nr:biotin--protein ligase isoform X2 [Ooceraea biroi]